MPRPRRAGGDSRRQAPPATAAVSLIFFASGAAGLVYEISWSRQLGLLFGHTVHAAAVVLAAYFFGMAVGSWLAGGFASRMRRPLLGYAAAELVVALWAAALPLVVDLSGTPALARLLSPPDPTLQTALRAITAFALLLPATIALGATLPCVAQHMARSTRHIARVYAWNVTGAFVGVVASTFVLLLAVGVVGSSLLAAAVSGLCAAAAAGLAVHLGPASGEPAPTAPDEPRAPAAPATLPARWTVVAALSGFGALGLQILYTRAFALTLHNSTYTFGSVVAIYLLALALGSALVGRMSHRVEPSRAAATACALGAAWVPLSILLLETVTGLGYFRSSAGFLPYMFSTLGLVALVVGPAVVALGTLLPLAWTGVRADARERGRIVGRLTAVNTLAATLGALVASFLLLPAAGLWTSFAIFAVAYLALGAALLGHPRRWLQSVWAPAALLVAIASPTARPEGLLPAQWRVLERWETPYGWIEVVEDRGTGARGIRQNLHYLYAWSSAALEQRFMGDLPLLLHPAPQRVLFLGMATGITSGAALAHPDVSRVDVVELVPEVVEAARYFTEYNAGLLDDARTRVFTNDARHQLAAADADYDVIVSDLFVPWHSQTGYLYTVEHYATVRKHLRPGGIFCQWIALWQVGPRELTTIADSLASVFPHVLLFRASDARKDMLGLVASEAPLELEQGVLTRRVARVRARRGSEDPPAATDLIGRYAGDWVVRPGALLNSDEHPRVEFLAPISTQERSRLVRRHLRDFYQEVLLHMPARNLVFRPEPGAPPWHPEESRQRQLDALARRPLPPGSNSEE